MSGAYVGPVTGTQYTASRARGLAPYKPRDDRRQMLVDILEVLADYRQYWPLSVRQIGYRLLGLEGYDKTESHFDTVGDLINRCRRSGVIPWQAIRDDNVHEQGDEGYDHLYELADVFAATAKTYQRHRQENQENRLQIWCEAAGMVPQVAASVRAFGVPVLSSSGFDSVTIKRNIALAVGYTMEPTIIGVIGDHDTHGLAAIDSRADDIRQFIADYEQDEDEEHYMVGSVEFEWLAVRPDQIDRYGLESSPQPAGKQTVGDNVDAQERTVQAEAIDPPDLRAIVRQFVADYIDVPIYFELRRTEREERRLAVAAVEAMDWSR